METIRMVIDAELLHEVDECARRAGLSRSSDRASAAPGSSVIAPPVMAGADPTQSYRNTTCIRSSSTDPGHSFSYARSRSGVGDDCPSSCISGALGSMYSNPVTTVFAG
jgi:hypothetical protein